MNNFFALATIACLATVVLTDDESTRGYAFWGMFIAGYLTFGA